MSLQEQGGITTCTSTQPASEKTPAQPILLQHTLAFSTTKQTAIAQTKTLPVSQHQAKTRRCPNHEPELTSFQDPPPRAQDQHYLFTKFSSSILQCQIRFTIFLISNCLIFYFQHISNSLQGNTANSKAACNYQPVMHLALFASVFPMLIAAYCFASSLLLCTFINNLIKHYVAGYQQIRQFFPKSSTASKNKTEKTRHYAHERTGKRCELLGTHTSREAVQMESPTSVNNDFIYI